MATATTDGLVVPRVGTVGAYMTGNDVAQVRQVREIAGRVTVTGQSGLRALAKFQRDGDLWGVDLDPACYLERGPEQVGLFPFDWIGRQRELGLSVVRSPGVHVPRADDLALRAAFAESLPDGTARTVSLDSTWLRPRDLKRLVPAIRGCDDPLALVLAAPFDPLDAVGAVDGLREVLDEASPATRRTELLRTDTTGIGFAATGGSLGAIGLSTTARHHGLPLGRRASERYGERQCSPLVFVRGLHSWQRGTTLGWLTPFRGAGLTGCSCDPCDGRTLLRFDRTWPSQVPEDVRADARAHDLHVWLALSRDVLGSNNPETAWQTACRAALRTAAHLAEAHKIVIRIPSSVGGWVK
jgi:hypothetical protein